MDIDSDTDWDTDLDIDLRIDLDIGSGTHLDTSLEELDLNSGMRLVVVEKKMQNDLV